MLAAVYLAAADKTNSIRTSIISGLWTNSRSKAIAFSHSSLKFIKINDLQWRIQTKKLIRAGMTGDNQVIPHGILFTGSMFLEEKPADKKRIKIQIVLLLEKHAPPFPPDLSPCMLPPACGMATKLPRALYFRAAK